MGCLLKLRLSAPEGPAGSRRSLAVALVLAAVLLYFAFRGVSWGELYQRLRYARLEVLVLVMVAFTCSYFCRGLRWGVLLSAVGRLPTLTVFWATATGYLGNSFLPARAGELIRSAMLARSTGVDVGYVLATAVTERVLDAGVLVLIGVVALTAVGELPAWLSSSMQVMAVAGALGLTGLFCVPRLEPLIRVVVARLPFGARRARVDGLVAKFLLGLRSFQDPARAAKFLGLTAVIWTIDTTAAIVCARGLDTTLLPQQAALLIAALGLASAAPSTPGFVGVYQFVTVSVLALFGIAQGEALAFILVFQGLTYVVTIALGLPGLWRLAASGRVGIVGGSA